MVELGRLWAPRRWSLHVKLDGMNPGGSSKDRAALRIIDDALADGRLRPGGLVVESSSGNMGLGLAIVCASYGIPFLCIVDPHTTRQNIALMRAYGATVEVVTVEDPVVKSYLPTRLARVRQVLAEQPGAFWPNQYENLSGVAAHYDGTGPEIARQIGGFPDWLFIAVGTCATIQGAARWFKDQGAPTRIVGVDSVGSVVLGGHAARRKIPGIGSAQKSSLLDMSLVDHAVHVEEDAAIAWCRRLARTEAVLAGGSSGCVLAAIDQLSDRFADGDVVVGLLPDRGSRYMDLIFDDGAPDGHR
jgi:cysteine synthase A